MKMSIYCKKCGAEIQSGLRVCLNCGEEVDLTQAQVRDEFSDGVVEEGYYDSEAARQDEIQNREEIQEDVRKHMTGVVLITLLIALAAIAIALAIMASNKTGIFAEKTSEDLFASQGNENQVIAVDTTAQDEQPVVEEQPAEQPEETVEEVQPEEPVNENAEKAAEIRRLLTTKKWKTTIEGYDGEVEFKNDGKAIITVKILFVKKSFDAKYILTDECEFQFTADYNGTAYGISGTIEKVNDNELKVIRAKNGDAIILKAV